MEVAKKKLRIGILSDSPFLVTGYATISSTLGNILVERGHDVIFFANGYMGQMVNPGVTFEDGRKLNFSIIGNGREAYFKDLLPVYTKQFNLDVLFILLDTFMLYPWLMQLDLSPAKVIFYYPSDGGGGMPLGCENILRFVHLPIAMAKFGQKQVKDMYGIDSDYIPHAADTKLYYPLPQEEKLNFKRMYGIGEDKFVVGTVARNQGRKMMDRTIKAFALYAKKDHDAVLFIHSDPDDAAQVFHMGALINRYNLHNRIIFSGMKYYKGFTYAQMNAIYNIMDVFMLTTSGEGFGIPIIEAMACSVPVLVTDYTTTRELIADTKSGLVINLVGETFDDTPIVHENELLDGTITGSWNVERGVCSIRDAANKLEILKKDEKLREVLGKNGRLAVLKEYNWDVCGKKFIERIEKLGGMY